MNRSEAIKALADGKRLSHPDFSPKEWVEKRGPFYVFEDGIQLSELHFWIPRSGEMFDKGWFEREGVQLTVGGPTAADLKDERITQLEKELAELKASIPQGQHDAIMEAVRKSNCYADDDGEWVVCTDDLYFQARQLLTQAKGTEND